MEKQTVSTEVMYEIELLIEEVENLTDSKEADKKAKELIDNAYRRLTNENKQIKLF